MPKTLPGNIVRLDRVRYRFGSVFEPRSVELGQGQGTPPQPGAATRMRYDVTLMIAKDSANDHELRAAFKHPAILAWREKADAQIRYLTSVNRIQYRDGDASIGKYPEYAGHMILTATRSATSGKPEVRDADGSLLTAAAGRPYRGCWVNAFVQPYVFTRPTERLNCGLLAVQFIADGDEFAQGATVPIDEFITTDSDTPATALWD